MKVLLIVLASLAGLFLLLRLIGLILVKTGKARPRSKTRQKPRFDHKQFIKDDPNEQLFVPSTKDLEGIEVVANQYPVDEPFPLPFEEGVVWIITGEKIGLKGTTVSIIKKALSAKGYSIQYYDKVLGNVTPEALAYNFPGIKADAAILSRERFTKAIIEGLGIDLAEKDVLFVRYIGKADPTLFDYSERNAFEVYVDSASNAEEFLIKAFAFVETLKDIRDSGIRFSISRRDNDNDIRFRRADSDTPKDVEPPTPDEIFDEGLRKVAQETYSSLSHLIMSGYSIEVIEGWLKQLSAPSHVVITKDYRIFLPDYNNLEIKMTQLPKTVFLFFLWFDVRCAIYQLQDHRDEFLAIYRKLSIFDDPQAMEDSIDRLVSANGVSFMEKCAAVKKAFTTKMSDRQAKNYYVHGEQGYSKGIDLDRSLVTWEYPLFTKSR